MQNFLKELKKHKSKLSRQQLKTLRGQALSGDLEAAKKGLNTLMKRGV